MKADQQATAQTISRERVKARNPSVPVKGFMLWASRGSESWPQDLDTERMRRQCVHVQLGYILKLPGP